MPSTQILWQRAEAPTLPVAQNEGLEVERLKPVRRVLNFQLLNELKNYSISYCSIGNQWECFFFFEEKLLS